MRSPATTPNSEPVSIRLAGVLAQRPLAPSSQSTNVGVPARSRATAARWLVVDPPERCPKQGDEGPDRQRRHEHAECEAAEDARAPVAQRNLPVADGHRALGHLMAEEGEGVHQPRASHPVYEGRHESQGDEARRQRSADSPCEGRGRAGVGSACHSVKLRRRPAQDAGGLWREGSRPGAGFSCPEGLWRRCQLAPRGWISGQRPPVGCRCRLNARFSSQRDRGRGRRV